jgi:hypothetical protein
MSLWTGLLIVAVLALVAARVVVLVRRYRGSRVITCPENGRPAGVELDANHAVLTALGAHAELRLSDCSRWPEKAGCGQECLRQIEASPEGCLVRHILTDWYAGKNCTMCGQPIGPIHLTDQKPGLLNSDGRNLDWRDIPADQIPGVLASARAVCFSCHLANSFAHEHPELVIDRHRPA